MTQRGNYTVKQPLKNLKLPISYRRMLFPVKSCKYKFNVNASLIYPIIFALRAKHFFRNSLQKSGRIGVRKIQKIRYTLIEPL